MPALAGQEPLPESSAESPDEVIADLLSDDALEFSGEAQALGGMLGQSEPMPLAEPVPAKESASKPPAAPPPTPPPTPFVETKPRDVPVLTDAPSDDELFGNLPDEVPEAAPRIAESARMGAAIVRREDLPNRVRDPPRRGGHGAKRSLLRFEDVAAVIAGDHQGVAPGDRKNVHEREREFVLTDDVSGGLAAHDLAEDTLPSLFHLHTPRRSGGPQSRTRIANVNAAPPIYHALTAMLRWPA